MPAENNLQPLQSSPTEPSGSTGRVVLTVNGGSSSIKFAVFDVGNPPQRLLAGTVDRIGLADASMIAFGPDGKVVQKRALADSSHQSAVPQLIALLREYLGNASVLGIGHRVVHGGAHLLDHQLITAELIAELKRVEPLDLAHLPREIALIEAFATAFKEVPQVACFDTAFHRDLPRVAQLLPIPYHYFEAGVRRFGFHGLSYSYLIQELARVAEPAEARGKVILAHLGSGASMAAVRNGKCVDTTMAFTPTAGLVMGTRPGDMDPGLLVYLMRMEKMSPEQMDDFISSKCGLVGLSGGNSDMRDLLSLRATDPHAADAVDVFCYQARKWIGALAAAMGGVDTIVFSGGIGEHAPEIRAAICDGLAFLGLQVDTPHNTASQPIISTRTSRVKVRVIKTDEEAIMVQAYWRVPM